MTVRNTKTTAERLKAIRSEKGVQHILDEAHRIMGNPVLIHDMEYKLIAASSCAVDDDPFWNDFCKNGGLSDERIEFCKSEGFIDEVANSTVEDGIAYLVSDKLKYNRFFGQIYNKNRIPVADLILLECESTFGDDTRAQLKILCDALSKEIGRSAYYLDYGQAYQEKIVKELIEGDVKDTNIYTGHIANLDTPLKRNVLVAVIDVSGADAQRDHPAFCRDLLKRTQPAFEYYVYRDRIVTLLSWDDDGLYEKKELKKLRKLFERENICAGISGRFENLFELQRYYRQAVAALEFGLNEPSAQRIFFYDEISPQE